MYSILYTSALFQTRTPDTLWAVKVAHKLVVHLRWNLPLKKYINRVGNTLEAPRPAGRTPVAKHVGSALSEQVDIPVLERTLPALILFNSVVAARKTERIKTVEKVQIAFLGVWEHLLPDDVVIIALHKLNFALRSIYADTQTSVFLIGNDPAIERILDFRTGPSIGAKRRSFDNRRIISTAKRLAEQKYDQPNKAEHNGQKDNDSDNPWTVAHHNAFIIA